MGGTILTPGDCSQHTDCRCDATARGILNNTGARSNHQCCSLQACTAGDGGLSFSGIQRSGAGACGVPVVGGGAGLVPRSTQCSTPVVVVVEEEAEEQEEEVVAVVVVLVLLLVLVLVLALLG